MGKCNRYMRSTGQRQRYRSNLPRAKLRHSLGFRARRCYRPAGQEPFIQTGNSTHPLFGLIGLIYQRTESVRSRSAAISEDIGV